MSLRLAAVMAALALASAGLACGGGNGGGDGSATGGRGGGGSGGSGGGGGTGGGGGGGAGRGGTGGGAAGSDGAAPNRPLGGMGGTAGAAATDARPADGQAGAGGSGGATDAGPPRDGGGGDAVVMACRAAGACDPFTTTASGCPDGQLCVADGMTDRASCLMATVMPAMYKREGEVCMGAGQCAPGLLCVAGMPSPICVRMCPRGSRRACSKDDERCWGTLTGQSCIQVCRPVPRPCDVHTQNCPTATDACTLATDPESGEGYTGCRPAGPRQEGEMCDGAANTCAKGLVCVRSGGVASCVRVCRPDGTPACTGGKTCIGMLPTYRLMFCQ